MKLAKDRERRVFGVEKTIFIPSKGEVVEKRYKLNALPEKPRVITPKDGEEGIQTEGVKLKWEAKDPDGDEVRYDLYLGTSPNDLKLIAKDLSRNSYNVKGLKGHRYYYWKAVAKDGYGGMVESDVRKFITSLKWVFKTGGDVDSSPAIGSDGTIYVGSEDNYLYAIYTDSEGLANSSWPMFRHDEKHTGSVEPSGYRKVLIGSKKSEAPPVLLYVLLLLAILGILSLALNL